MTRSSRLVFLRILVASLKEEAPGSRYMKLLERYGGYRPIGRKVCSIWKLKQAFGYGATRVATLIIDLG